MDRFEPLRLLTRPFTDLTLISSKVTEIGTTILYYSGSDGREYRCLESDGIEEWVMFPKRFT